MKVIHSISEIRNELQLHRSSNQKIGLIPTMGALHEGHLALIDRCHQESDISVLSIFVNPIQFNNKNDLNRYPRDLDKDIKSMEGREVSIIFAPSEHEIYPSEPEVFIDFGSIGSQLEGKFRPGHFDGVGIVVSKLFNIIQPDFAYFGLKDLQQYLLITKMVKELNFPVHLRGIETIRDSNGLALSSRNQLLSDRGRIVASKIYEGLTIAKNRLEEGHEVEEIKSELIKFYESVENMHLEYLVFVNPENLKETDCFNEDNELAICFAGFVEGVRLIDNLYLR